MIITFFRQKHLVSAKDQQKMSKVRNKKWLLSQFQDKKLIFGNCKKKFFRYFVSTRKLTFFHISPDGLLPNTSTHEHTHTHSHPHAHTHTCMHTQPHSCEWWGSVCGDIDEVCCASWWLPNKQQQQQQNGKDNALTDWQRLISTPMTSHSKKP